MPMHLEGSCQCGSIRFSVESHTPVPYQRCYCSICRKSAGGGGFAVNIGARADSLRVNGKTTFFHARHDDGRLSPAERHFCPACGSALWLFDARWPDLVHPHASAIDTPLPRPPVLTHIMLDDKPDWVLAEFGPDDEVFARYPSWSLEQWHRAQGLWVD